MGNQILFTDETQIDMGSYTKDSIRLSKANKEKLAKGEKEVFNLINREEKKFEPSIMIAGGICSGGLTDIIIQEGTLNEFAYAQVLLFYKDSFEKIKEEINKDLYFEQDGASAHTSFSNKKLIEELFGKNKLIQNPPNSPDLAYPIENIWGYIKPRIKRKNPKTMEELKKIHYKNGILSQKKLIKNCGLNYVKRLEKVIELEGERLEPFHLQEIKMKIKEKNEMEDEGPIEENNLKMKVAYNDQRLNKLRKKEIARLKKVIKAVKKEATEKIRQNNVKTRKIPGIAQLRKERKIFLKKRKEEDIQKIENQNQNIKK